MELQKQQICCDSIIYDGLPPISPKYPWLLDYNPGSAEADQIFYNLNDPLSKFHCQIPQLFRKRIRGCFHGWLILSDYPHNNNLTLSLWNPHTSKVICLPPLILKDKDYESIGECCLSSPPDDPSSIILLTRTNKPHFVFSRVNHKRKSLENWIERSYDKQLKRITSEDGLRVCSLTCCNGKVYALNVDHSLDVYFVLKVDILVKDTEVLIKLSLFGECPYTDTCCANSLQYLKGSCTELFYISVGFHEKTQKTPRDVGLFKLDMTSIKREEMEVFKGLDMTSMSWLNIFARIVDKDDIYRYEDLKRTRNMWEEMVDLKDAVFFVDVSCDYSIFYSSIIASKCGGFIHIRGKTDDIIYSYHVRKKTISLSSMPSPVLPTSHISMWECRLEEDHEEIKFVIDSKQEEEGKDCEIVVRSVTNQEVKFDESSLLLNLPFSILESIMELCVGVEYMKFRATCKLCRLAAPPIKWNNKTTLGRLQNYSLVSPWLVVADKNQGVLTFTDPVFGGNYYMNNFPALFEDRRIYCSMFGWLLVKSKDFPGLVFFNPFTRDIHKLPRADCCLDTACFSAPPTSPDCMVVVFSIYPARYLLIHFVARESSWRRLHVGADPLTFHFPTFKDRDLFALSKEGKLTVFKDLGKENYSWKLLEAQVPKSCCKSLATYYLMKRDQHILTVVMGEFGELVEVFKWIDATKEWEKIHSIGKHMIYICGSACICTEAKLPEMENKIYFPRLHSENGNIVFYSLETCMYHTFNDKNIVENFEDFMGTDYHLNTHAWIEPSWS